MFVANLFYSFFLVVLQELSPNRGIFKVILVFFGKYKRQGSSIHLFTPQRPTAARAGPCQPGMQTSLWVSQLGWQVPNLELSSAASSGAH